MLLTEDEQLEGTGFVFQNITEVIIEFHRTRDISASSYIELSKKYKNSKNIINIQNDDVFCFLWCILARFNQVAENRNRPMKYSKHLHTLNVECLKFPIRIKGISTSERLNNLNVNVCELTGSVLSPVQFNTNYTESQNDLMLYKNH